MQVEMRVAARGGLDFGEPFRWSLLGGPGIGKFHVVRILKDRLFKIILHWDLGFEFQIVALQTVMADLLGVVTIHHACGTLVFKRTQNHQIEEQRHIDIAKRVLQWRWLIIGEVSMVSATPLAAVALTLREIIRGIGTLKSCHNSAARSFGGLTILMYGDVWQLPPPDGGFFENIPG